MNSTYGVVNSVKHRIRKAGTKKLSAVCISLLLALNIIVSGIPVSASASAAGGAVSTYQGLIDAVTAANINETTTIKLAGNIKIGGTITVKPNRKIIITPSADGNVALSREDGFNGDMFKVERYGELALDNITLNGALLGGDSQQVMCGSLVVLEGSELLLENGSVLTGNYAENGAGVYSTGGSITMKDGSRITGNRANTNGGGIYAKESTVNSPVVTGNTAGGNGGGVYAQGMLNLNGNADNETKITGNTAADSKQNNLYLNITDTAQHILAADYIYYNKTDIGISAPNAMIKPKAVVAHVNSVMDATLFAQGLKFDGDVTGYTMVANGGNVTIENNADTAVCKGVLTTQAAQKGIALYPSEEFNVIKSGGESHVIIRCPAGLEPAVQNAAGLSCSLSYLYDEYEYGDTISHYDYYDCKIITDGSAAGTEFSFEVGYVPISYLQKTVLSNTVSIPPSTALYEADQNGYTQSVNADAARAFTVTASSMNSSASLTAEYFTKDEGKSVSAILNGAFVKADGKKGEVSGYVKLSASVAEGTFVSPDVKSVKLAVDMSSTHYNGQAVDLIVYNGKDTKLYSSVAVLNGYASIGVDYEKAEFYIAIVDAASPRARIGDKTYQTVEEAFAQAANKDTVVLLADSLLRGSLVVSSAKIITVTSNEGGSYTLSRAKGFNKAMFYVGGGCSLTLDGIILDGKGSLTEITGGYYDANNMRERSSAVVNDNNLTIQNCSIVNNCLDIPNSNDVTKINYGGAVYNTKGSNLAIANTLIKGCSAVEGGAIYNDGSMTMTSGRIFGNYAQDSGGGIYNSVNATAELAGGSVTLNNCSDKQNAGGIANYGIIGVSGSLLVVSNTSGTGASSKITSNLSNFSHKENPVRIVDELSVSAMIGVCVPKSSGDVVAEGYGSKIKDAEGYINNFFLDTAELNISAKDKKLVIGSSNTKYFTVSVVCEGSKGKAEPSGDIRVPKDSARTFTFTPDLNYVISDVKLDGVSILKDERFSMDEKTDIGTFVLKDINKDYLITVAFKPEPAHQVTATVTTSATPGGTISPAKIKMDETDSVIFTMTPASTYCLTDLTVNGVSVIKDVKDNKYTLTGVQKDTALIATFEQIYQTRTLTDPTNGITITGNIHHDAVLVVRKLTSDSNRSSNDAGLYAQLYNALGTKEYIHSAYDIRVEFPDDRTDETPFTGSLTMRFELGTSYKGRSAKVFHTNNSEVDKTSYSGTVDDKGVLTISNITKFSPYAVVLTEKDSGGSNNNGNGSATVVDDGKNTPTGDNMTGAIIALAVLLASGAVVLFVVRMHYIPRLIKWIRNRGMA